MLSSLAFGQAARAGIPTLVVPTRHAQLRCLVAQRDWVLRLLLNPDGAVSEASETLLVRRSRLRSSTFGKLGRSVVWSLLWPDREVRKQSKSLMCHPNTSQTLPDFWNSRTF